MDPAAATDSAAVLKALNERFDKAAAARKPHDIEWVLDISFFGGQHYTEWSNDKSMFQPIAKDRPKAPRPVDNRIYSLVMDAYASAKDTEVAVEVLPTTVDSMDVSNAKVAQAYIDHLCFPTQAAWELRRDTALFWVALVGEGWLKWTMSEAKKRPDIAACSPLEIYLPPNCPMAIDAPWIIHARGMDPEDVYEEFGVELPANAVDRGDASKQAILRQNGLVSGTPTVTVKELWELPCRRHPAGRYIVWAGPKLISSGPFPYAHGMLPFTQILHSPVPGTPHGQSGTRTARPINMELNQYHAQKIESRKNFANFKWFLDSALAESMEERPNDDVNQILVGDSRNGAMKPEIMQAQIWPDSNDGEWLEAAFQNAVGLHEASMGQAPGRVDSAQGIDQLQQADKGRLSLVESTLGDARARGFGMLIELAREFVHEEQILPCYNPAGGPSVARFKTDIFPAKPILRVVKGGGLPKNKSARQAQVIAMWTAGLLGADPRKALELLDFPIEMNLTGTEQDYMEAWQENLLMLRGEAVTPEQWQNHDIHREVHNACRKSAEFASSTDEVWSRFEFHLKATDTAELEEIAEEAERQAWMQKAAEDAVAKVSPPEPDPAAPVDPNAPPAPDQPAAEAAPAPSPAEGAAP